MLLDEFDEMEKNDYVFICFRRKLLDESLHNAFDFIPEFLPEWGDHDRSALMSRIYNHVRSEFDNDYSIDYSREFRMGLVERPEYDTEKLESEREHYSKMLVLDYLIKTVDSIQNMIRKNNKPEDIARIFHVPVSSVMAISGWIHKNPCDSEKGG